MHGISAIIVIILAVTIVISMTALFYTFSSMLTTSTTTTAKGSLNTAINRLTSQMRVVSASSNNIVIRNTGQADISNFSVLINGATTSSFNVVPPVIKPGQIGTITVYDFVNKDDNIQLISSGASVNNKAPDPCKDAVLCSKFDEGKGISSTDASSNGNNGVFNGETFNDGTSYSGSTPTDLHTISGKYGKALQFDGLNDYVDAGNKNTLNPTNQITIEAWIKLDQSTLSHGQSMMILAKRHSVSPWYSYFLQVYNDSGTNEILFEYVNGAGQPINTGTDINLNINTWYYVTAVLNATGYPRIYINGIDSTNWGGQQLVGNLYQSNYPLFIGADYSEIGYQEFNGTIDEVRIYNRSLSQAEINADMQSSLPTSRTIASYSFEEPSSATYVNDTHIWVQGRYDKALSFDGVDDYVDAGNKNTLNPTNQITIEAWIKFNTLGNMYIVGKDDLASNRQYYMRYNSVNNFSTRVFTSSGSSELMGVVLQTDRWYHVAMTWNGSTHNQYVDGVLVKTDNIGGTLNTGTKNLIIGSISAGNSPFNGTIDEVRIYNKAIY